MDEHGFAYQWSYTTHDRERRALTLTLDVVCDHQPKCEPFELVKQVIDWAQDRLHAAAE